MWISVVLYIVGGAAFRVSSHVRPSNYDTTRAGLNNAARSRAPRHAMSPVRFATIGTNFITDKLLDAAQSVPGFCLAAVYSRNSERAAEFAAKHNCQLTFTSLEELAKSTEVDAVYIASPTSEHARQAILFLNHGKHVLVEKPACSNGIELEAVLVAASQSGCAFMEAVRPLKTPNFACVQERLRDIGPARQFSAQFCQLSSRWPAHLRGERPNAFEPRFSNGALMDLGCYCIYSAVALLGRPSKVSYSAIMLPSGVDGAGSLVLQYENDTLATLTISKMSQGFNYNELQTEKGTIRIDTLLEYSEVLFAEPTVRANKAGTTKRTETQSLVISEEQLQNNMQYELDAFVDMVQTGRQQDDILTWNLARDVAMVLDKARQDAGIIFPADIASKQQSARAL